MHLSRPCHVREIAGPFFPAFISLASLLFNSRTEQHLENIELWNYVFFAKRCYLILLNSDFNNLTNFYKKRLWGQEWYFMLHMRDRKLGQHDCAIEMRESFRVNNLFAEYSRLSSFLSSCEKASSFQLRDRQRRTRAGHSGWAEGQNAPCSDVACLPAEAFEHKSSQDDLPFGVWLLLFADLWPLQADMQGKRAQEEPEVLCCVHLRHTGLGQASTGQESTVGDSYILKGTALNRNLGLV